MGAESQTNRLSLSSSAFAGRVKKFDSYEPTQAQGRRTPVQNQQRLQPKPIQTAARSHTQVAQPQPKNVTSTQQRPKTIAKPQPINRRAVQSPSVQNAVSSSRTETLAMHAVGRSIPENKSVLADQFEESRFVGGKTKKEKGSKLVFAMNSIAIIVFIFASAVSVQTLLTNQQTQDVLADKAEQVNTADAQGVSEGTGRDPAEQPVPDNAIINYQVAPDLPRYLSIPDIDVFARIKHTGLDNEGAVDSPRNIHDVSWYDGSAEPGNAIGASLLLGHVQGWSAPGVFKNIDQLENGARFTVEKGNGETLTYEVTKSQEFALEDVNMGQILSAEENTEHDLKLMTCSGEYDAANESYLSRYVVYAKIVR